MEAVIFIGLQAAGKSSFYKERFFATHLRISLDMLKTRHRERTLLTTCIALRQPFVVDNTNPTQAERSVYITAAHDAGFRVLGYYFQSQVAECIQRNAARDTAQVPEKAILGTSRRLQLPSMAEGFDTLFYVKIVPGGFQIELEHSDSGILLSGHLSHGPDFGLNDRAQYVAAVVWRNVCRSPVISRSPVS